MNSNFRAGVASVTLRQHAFVNFMKHVVKTGLSCIEWGSDIHAPYNDLEKAAAIAYEMRANNLSAASYGSYYKLGDLPFDQIKSKNLFGMILSAAKVLGAPMIRVWGGERASKFIDAGIRRSIIDDAVAVAETAKKDNIDISVEYHQNTITDTVESALGFIRDVRNSGGDNVYLYWQMNHLLDFTGNKHELTQVLPFLSNIHVQAREGDARLMLAEQKHHWEEYIEIVKSTGRKHDFLIEFTKNDNPDNLAEDAKTLIELLENA